jgi:predicted RNase H-like HicB family nuclease
MMNEDRMASDIRDIVDESDPERDVGPGFLTDLSRVSTFPVGLEQGRDGSVLAHSLTLPGCVGGGPDPETALADFAEHLTFWLRFLGSMGEPPPSQSDELKIVVEEWVSTDADVAQGRSTALFEADRHPLLSREIDVSLRRLGDLRGRLLRTMRAAGEPALDRNSSAGWSARRVADELARAQWWTLTRLGASPLAEVPVPTLRRLDTAMALVVQQLTRPPTPAESLPLDLDGELWTPRKVIRTLLWLEWSLGGTVIEILSRLQDPG